MRTEVKIIHGSGEDVFLLKPGEKIASFLQEKKLLSLPCAASGKCGKCLIYSNAEPTEQELRLLGSGAVASGLRLACRTVVAPGLEIRIPPASALCVLSSFTGQDYHYAPCFSKVALTVPPPRTRPAPPTLNFSNRPPLSSAWPCRCRSLRRCPPACGENIPKKQLGTALYTTRH